LTTGVAIVWESDDFTHFTDSLEKTAMQITMNIRHKIHHWVLHTFSLTHNSTV